MDDGGGLEEVVTKRKERMGVILVKKAFLLIKTLPVFTCLCFLLLVLSRSRMASWFGRRIKL